MKNSMQTTMNNVNNYIKNTDGSNLIYNNLLIKKNMCDTLVQMPF